MRCRRCSHMMHLSRCFALVHLNLQRVVNAVQSITGSPLPSTQSFFKVHGVKAQDVCYLGHLLFSLLPSETSRLFHHCYQTPEPTTYFIHPSQIQCHVPLLLTLPHYYTLAFCLYYFSLHYNLCTILLSCICYCIFHYHTCCLLYELHANKELIAC